jgi:integrase
VNHRRNCDGGSHSAFQSHRVRYGPKAAERLKAGEWQDGSYVFTDDLRKPYSPDYVSKSFEDLVEASGLPRARLHDLRHTAFSLMLAVRVQPKVVQELAGHSNISITLGIYGQTTPSMGRDAGAALSASLLG